MSRPPVGAPAGSSAWRSSFWLSRWRSSQAPPSRSPARQAGHAYGEDATGNHRHGHANLHVEQSDRRRSLRAARLPGQHAGPQAGRHHQALVEEQRGAAHERATHLEGPRRHRRHQSDLAHHRPRRPLRHRRHRTGPGGHHHRRLRQSGQRRGHRLHQPGHVHGYRRQRRQPALHCHGDSRKPCVRPPNHLRRPWSRSATVLPLGTRPSAPRAARR